jgi:hypothetical protein
LKENILGIEEGESMQVQERNEYCDANEKKNDNQRALCSRMDATM